MPSAKPLNFSVLVPTCNRPDLLKRFLDSLAGQTRQPAEVVVVDQSDDGKTREVFEAWSAPKVEKKYVHRKVKSLILSRNVALDLAGGTDFVAFFDDDVVLRPDFCEKMLRVFEGPGGNGYAGGMGTIEGTRKKNGLIQKFFFMPHDGDGKFLPSGVPTFPHWSDKFQETEFVSGGITFWRREIIKKYRYDERLVGYGYGDDIDVSYRISRKYKLFYQPAAVCFHDEHAPGRDKARIYRHGWIQNMYYLAEKNHVSRLAYAWCVVGHILRDAVLLDKERVAGDLSAVANILTGRIDTVTGYKEFRRDHA